MATTKITVTVPGELADYIKQQVTEGNFASVSAFMTAAAERMRDLNPLDLMIASMVAETGEPTEADEAWVEEAMAKAKKARHSASANKSGKAA